MNDAADFLVRRDDLRTARIAAIEPARLELANGQALLRVDHFAFTANNITYAVAAICSRYWNFFPAEHGWGRVPVWGFADVVASRGAGVREGTRLYGYYPMSTHLVVEPANASEAGFVDGAAHRAPMAARLQPVPRGEPRARRRAARRRRCCSSPLFVTAFLIDDFLAESGFFGARSASCSRAPRARRHSGSRTSSRGAARIEVVGLTSPNNTAFVEGLGCYDRVVSYGELASLDPTASALFVDMAGNGAVQSAVHHHFGVNLVHSLSVGLTHWEHGKRESGLPGAEPSFFFAPDQLRRRFADWGPEGFQQRIQAAFDAFRARADRALRVVRGRRADVARVYLDALEGRTRPDEGHILSLHEG